MIADYTSLFQSHSTGGSVRLLYNTDVYLGRLGGGPIDSVRAASEPLDAVAHPRLGVGTLVASPPHDDWPRGGGNCAPMEGEVKPCQESTPVT